MLQNIEQQLEHLMVVIRIVLLPSRMELNKLKHYHFIDPVINRVVPSGNDVPVGWHLGVFPPE